MSIYNYQEGAIHNDNHKEMTVNVSGKMDIAALVKTFLADDIEEVEEIKDNKSEINHSPEEIIRYVMKLHPVYVSERWKEHYRSLWETVLKLSEVENIIYDKGRQKNTTFNRNLVGNILCLMADKEVLCGNNATKFTVALENNEKASIRFQIGTMPPKAIRDSVTKTIESFFG